VRAFCVRVRVRFTLPAPFDCRRCKSRGFTLIELMAVVVITSILALAGVSLFRQQLVASKGTEAVSVIPIDVFSGVVTDWLLATGAWLTAWQTSPMPLPSVSA